MKYIVLIIVSLLFGLVACNPAGNSLLTPTAASTAFVVPSPTVATSSNPTPTPSATTSATEASVIARVADELYAEVKASATPTAPAKTGKPGPSIEGV